jgi:hypothetical protein
LLIISEICNKKSYLARLLERGSCLMMMTSAQMIRVLAKNIKYIFVNRNEGTLLLWEQHNRFMPTESVNQYASILVLFVRTMYF